MRWQPYFLVLALGCNAQPESSSESKMTVDPAIANAGAIICSHVAAGEPILRATRDNPMDPDDSGWQFLCDSGADERIEDAKIWTVTQVTEHDPTILQFINFPIGTTMARPDANSEWQASE
jgi:hypothetical protein